MADDPRDLFHSQGPAALLAAVPGFLRDEDSALDLLILLQTDTVPSRWHRRITSLIVENFWDRDAPPGILLAEWVIVFDKHERLHPDQRAHLFHKNLLAAPDDTDALVRYIACQLQDEYLHDGDLASLPVSSPGRAASLALVADLLAWRIAAFAPARDCALAHLIQLDPVGRERVAALLALAGWEDALAELMSAHP